MASFAQRRPIGLKLIIYIFAGLWLLMAAFPFVWTVWGSFKVELDFFSIADWTYALLVNAPTQNTAVLLPMPDTKAHGFKKNSGAM